MNGFDTAKPLYTLTVGEFFQMMEDFVQSVFSVNPNIL